MFIVSVEVPGKNNGIGVEFYAIEENFLPALFNDNTDITSPLRQRLALSVRYSGLGIPSPQSTATTSHQSSRAITMSLTASLLNRIPLDAAGYKATAMKLRSQERASRDASQKQLFKAGLTHLDKPTRQCVASSCKTGAWLTLLPDRLNATDLSAEEFRDSLRIRFDLRPQALQDRCDGCDQPFTVRHAMS